MAPDFSDRNNPRGTAAGSVNTYGSDSGSTTGSNQGGSTQQEVKQKASQAADQAKEKADQFASQAKETAQSAAEKAKQQVTTQLAGQKEKATEQLGGITRALRETSDKLREEDQDMVARYLDDAAGQVDRLSQYLRNHTVNELLTDAQNFARREPALFVGGGLLLGLLGARFFKSHSPEPSYRAGQRYGGSRSVYEPRYTGARRYQGRPYESRAPYYGSRSFDEPHYREPYREPYRETYRPTGAPVTRPETGSSAPETRGTGTTDLNETTPGDTLRTSSTEGRRNG